MSLEIRFLDVQRDFPRLTEFWTQYGLPAVPLACLPPTGLVVEQDDVLLCGAFLVKSDTNLASIAFVSANPKADKKVRSEALDTLLLNLASLAKTSGFPLLAAATNVPALQARYERLGFLKTDENVVCYAGRT